MIDLRRSGPGLFLNRAFWALKRRAARGGAREHIIFRWEPAADRSGFPAGEIVTVRDPAQLADVRGLERVCDPAFARSELLNGALIEMVPGEGSPDAVAFHGVPRAWYVPLGPRDEVVYAVVTAPRAWGRGYAGMLAAGIARKVAARGGTAYLDCAAWNVRAHRAFERAGFRRVNGATHPYLATALGNA